MILGVRAIIKKGDSIIMVEHTESEYGKFLLFPGGGVEKNESIFSAVEREVQEETNLIVKAKSILYVREVEHNNLFGVEFYILCEYVSGLLSLGCDPELVDKNQILTSIKELPISELDDQKWKPEELHNRLVCDLENILSVKDIKYLGLVSL
jgi:ADP-ribose pyrophosphatase YjhB (NUDIX family)